MDKIRFLFVDIPSYKALALVFGGAIMNIRIEPVGKKLHRTVSAVHYFLIIGVIVLQSDSTRAKKSRELVFECVNSILNVKSLKFSCLTSSVTPSMLKP